MQRSFGKTSGTLLKALNNNKFYLSYRSVMGEKGQEPPTVPSSPSTPPSQMLPADVQGSQLGKLNTRPPAQQEFITMMVKHSDKDSDNSGQNPNWRETTFTMGNTMDQEGKLTDAVTMSDANNDEGDEEDEVFRIMRQGEDSDWMLGKDDERSFEQESGYASSTSMSIDDGGNEDDDGEDGDDDHDDGDRNEPRAESIQDQTRAPRNYEGVYWTGDGRRIDTRLGDAKNEGAYVRGDGKSLRRSIEEPEIEQPRDMPETKPRRPKSKN